MIESLIVVPFLLILFGVDTAFGDDIHLTPPTAGRVDAFDNVINQLVGTLTDLQDEIQEVKSKVAADDTEVNVEKIKRQIKAEEVKNDIFSNPSEKPVLLLPNHNVLATYVRKAVMQSDVKFTEEDNEAIKAAFKVYMISQLPSGQYASLITMTSKLCDNLTSEDLAEMLQLYSKNEELVDEMTEEEFVRFLNYLNKRYDHRNVNGESEVDIIVDDIKDGNPVNDVHKPSLMGGATAAVHGSTTKLSAPLRRATAVRDDEEEDRKIEKELLKTTYLYMAAKEHLEWMYGPDEINNLLKVKIMDDLDNGLKSDLCNHTDRTNALIKYDPDMSVGDILYLIWQSYYDINY